jgi:carboxypeptidase T
MLDNFPNIRAMMDVHSYLELVLHPWGDDELQTTDPGMSFMTQDTLDPPRHKLTQPDPELRKRLEALFFRWILRAGLCGSAARS